MSYIKIIAHCVWSTKNREPLLENKDFRNELYKHILLNARKKKIFIHEIGGEKEHIHCLISIGSEQNIADIIKLIKGESAFWINNNSKRKFQWQKEYFAVSVSQSQIETVRSYILNQEEHHKRKTYDQEHMEFKEKYQFPD